eukprot:1179814-Prorocentrum_minimum.AAC.5
MWVNNRKPTRWGQAVRWAQRLCPCIFVLAFIVFFLYVGTHMARPPVSPESQRKAALRAKRIKEIKEAMKLRASPGYEPPVFNVPSADSFRPVSGRGAQCSDAQDCREFAHRAVDSFIARWNTNSSKINIESYVHNVHRARSELQMPCVPRLWLLLSGEYRTFKDTR